MAVSQTVLKRWVFIGSGQTHLLTLKNLLKRVPPEVEILFVSEQVRTPIVEMFPAFIAGLYRQDEFYVSLEELLNEVGGKLIKAKIKSIDQKNKKLKLSDDSVIEFDLLSVDSDPFIATEQFPGATSYAHLLLPINDFQNSILNFCQSLRGKRKVDLVFIGAGLLSIECALALRQRLKIYGADVFVHVIELNTEGEAKLVVADRVQSELKKYCDSLGFKFHSDVKIKEILATEILLEDGSRIKSDFTSLAHTIKAPEFLSKSDLDLYNGFVSINHFLQASNSHIFCVGNTSKDAQKKWLPSKRQIRKQAKILAHNLRALSQQTKLKKYRPNQSDFRMMIDGRGGALAFKGSLYFKPSHFLWELKDWVDKKFLESFKVSEKNSEKSSDDSSGRDPKDSTDSTDPKDPKDPNHRDKNDKAPKEVHAG